MENGSKKTSGEKKDFNMDSTSERIVPLKDHVIKQNKFYYDLKKGEPIYVNKLFIQTLKTEKVI